LEHVATEHFWMSGMYWGLTAMALMGKLDQMDTAKILDWVSGCSCGQGWTEAGCGTCMAELSSAA
jgi:geranylgeranyl transferase type-2 subunit beta